MGKIFIDRPEKINRRILLYIMENCTITNIFIVLMISFYNSVSLVLSLKTVLSHKKNLPATPLIPILPYIYMTAAKG